MDSSIAVPYDVWLLAVGIRRARCVAYSMFSMVVYEYFITLDLEAAYFWTGQRTLSRLLFFLNRYLNIVACSLSLYAVWASNGARWLLILVAVISTSGLLTIQVMHALRLWYLFSHSTATRLFLIALTVGYHATEWTIVIQYLTQDMDTRGRLWLPALVVHSILYVLTIVRALTPRQPSGEGKYLMNRVLREGGMLASAAFATSLFDTIAAFESDPRVSLPARNTELMLAIMSVIMSRLMFNIRRLSASLGTEPEILLSDMELSRIKCTKGMNAGELLVEVNPVGPDEYELSDTNTGITEVLCTASPSYEKVTQMGLSRDGSVGSVEELGYGTGVASNRSTAVASLESTHDH